MCQHGEVSVEEMLRVFNMGIGMVLILAPADVDRVVRRLETSRQPYFFIGNVTKGSGKVRYDFPPAGFPSWIE
jgi:phosphoribosylformylglycinamidine cyclo-ligase